VEQHRTSVSEMIIHVVVAQASTLAQQNCAKAPAPAHDTTGQRMPRQVVWTSAYILGVSNTCASLALLCAAAKSVCLRPSLALASACINAVLRTSSVVSDIAPLP
jgi:hypothetical protein